MLRQRNESRMIELLKATETYVERIHTEGFDPYHNADEVVKLLEGAELIVCKPEGEFQKSLEGYTQQMSEILSSAYKSACARHMKARYDEEVRDAQEAMNLLESYAVQAGLELSGE